MTPLDRQRRRNRKAAKAWSRKHPETKSLLNRRAAFIRTKCRAWLKSNQPAVFRQIELESRRRFPAELVNPDHDNKLTYNKVPRGD
jgi:hypothetical protein